MVADVNIRQTKNFAVLIANLQILDGIFGKRTLRRPIFADRYALLLLQAHISKDPVADGDNGAKGQQHAADDFHRLFLKKGFCRLFCPIRFHRISSAQFFIVWRKGKFIFCTGKNLPVQPGGSMRRFGGRKGVKGSSRLFFAQSQ